MWTSILTPLIVVSFYHCGISQGTIHVDSTVKLLKPNEEALLACPVTPDPSGNKTVRWFRINPDGKMVELRIGDVRKYAFDSTNNTLTVFKVGEHDIGPYMCHVGSLNYTVSISIAPVIRPFEKSRNLVEDEELKLACLYWAWPSANVSWYRTHPNTGDTLVNATYLANISVLTIDHVTRSDYMKYICVVANEVGTNNATILVRVKYRLAPLWPFLGIVAEIVILIVIIIVYEKRRSKQLADDARKDEAEQLTNSTEHKDNDDVRQRK